jgi:uncharacterized protein DUF6805/beta-L-arabinofuranosidase (glycosyl hydrolase family 127)
VKQEQTSRTRLTAAQIRRMPPSRRDFLQQTAATASLAAIGPIASTAESLRAVEATSPPPSIDAARIRAQPVPSSRVRVLGGPLKRARDITAKYLLELEPDRMLAYYRIRAGLPQKAEPYSGWDGGGRNLTGGDVERDRQFNYQSDPSDRGIQRSARRTSRAGGGWFSFDMPVDGSGDVAVVVTYLNDLGLPPASGNFEIIVDGMSLGRFEPNGSAVGFYDVRYAVPAELARGKAKVTVRFQASQGGRIAPVFGVRTIRSTGA